MLNRDTLLQIKEETIKNASANYVDIPFYDKNGTLNRLSVLTNIGKHKLSEEGLLGLYKNEELRLEIYNLKNIIRGMEK